jgi:hypothetical protein
MRPQTRIRKEHQNNSLQDPPDVSHHFPTDSCKSDSDLVRVNEMWDRLPKAIRAGILAMVKSVNG